MSDLPSLPAGATGAPAPAGRVVVPVPDLRVFTEQAFRVRGMSHEHAATVADALLWANLRGVDTHGVTRVPRYVELIDLGDMNATPAMVVKEVAAGSVSIEADRAPGPVAMMRGMNEAIARARVAGIGIAVVRATTHTAALGYYTRHATEAQCLGIAFSGSSPNMAYHGARAAGVSTSPLSIAAPGGDAQSPIVLDIASGVVSLGRIAQARKMKQTLPPGLAIDREGNPTTDPAQAWVPLPMAGPKGSGLALMIELLSSVLAGNPLLAESLEGTAAGKRHRQNGVCIAIDIARFIDPAAFALEAGRLARDIHALPATDPAEPPMTPGERGDRMMRLRAQTGIPLPPPVAADLRALAARLAIPLPAALGV